MSYVQSDYFHPHMHNAAARGYSNFSSGESFPYSLE
jgi:hypothetical protein